MAVARENATENDSIGPHAQGTAEPITSVTGLTYLMVRLSQ